MFGYKSHAEIREWKLTVAVYVVCMMSGGLMCLVGLANFTRQPEILNLLSMCSGLAFMGISFYKLLMLIK